MINLNPPNPHPLDFDWRFTSETVGEIRNVLDDVPTLAVGAPSIARYLEQTKKSVLLVDRQPFQGVSNHIRMEVGGELPGAEKYSQAIVDPPWYPEELINWVAWAANKLNTNSVIFVSIWPSDVRPLGHSETSKFVKWAQQWAEMELLPIVPLYEKPLFERRALEFSDGSDLCTSPRRGRLLKLIVKHPPELPKIDASIPKASWVRFVANDYQLALNLSCDSSKSQSILMHPKAVKWHWPYVSRRAPLRDLIGLWSSENEAAIVQNPRSLLKTLRAAFQQTNAQSFEKTLEEFPELYQWNIPRPPYQRLFEWQHQ